MAAHKSCVNKKNVTLRIDAKVLSQAKELGFNISKNCELALKHKIESGNNPFFNECFLGKKFCGAPAGIRTQIY